MTAVLADTATIVWWLSDDPQLSADAITALTTADEADGIFVSSVTLLDIWYATHKRRDPLTLEHLAQLDHALEDPEVNVHVVPVTVEVARLAREPARDEVPDPFDRIVLATARYRGVPLVTPDGILRGLDLHPTVW